MSEHMKIEEYSKKCIKMLQDGIFVACAVHVNLSLLDERGLRPLKSEVDKLEAALAECEETATILRGQPFIQAGLILNGPDSFEPADLDSDDKAEETRLIAETLQAVRKQFPRLREIQGESETRIDAIRRFTAFTVRFCREMGEMYEKLNAEAATA